MPKLLTLGLASVFVVVTGCQDSNTTGPLVATSFFHAAASHDFEFVMLDDFAVENTGAGGSGLADVDGVSVEVEVKAEGLIPDVDYELNVTLELDVDTGLADSFVTFGPVTANQDGEVEFEGVITLDPGAHRLDLFVTRTGSTGTGVVFGLFDRDLLLRCAPAVSLTIVADD